MSEEGPTDQEMERHFHDDDPYYQEEYEDKLK